MKSIYLCLLILIGCEDLGLPTDFKVDPDLKPYVESFYREAFARGVHPHHNVEVRLGSTGGRYILGVTRRRGSFRRITISRSFFNDMVDLYDGDTLFHSMEHLMFHEMGHAVLDLEHCDPCFGIMHSTSSIMTYVGDAPLREKMIDELFQQ